MLVSSSSTRCFFFLTVDQGLGNERKIMRAVVQRVKGAKVDVEGRTVGEIGTGLLVFLGVGHDDSEKDCEVLAGKIIHLRIFSDEQGLMNRSVLEMGGGILVVSQFTLWG